jgi:glutamine amidotransferase
MSRRRVVVIDYGVGNLHSVRRAFENCGGDVITSSDPEVIANADRVVLPGVGAFGNGVKALESRGLIDIIRKIASDGIPLLGICLGMQLLLSESEEHGLHKGLALIPGRVVKIRTVSVDGDAIKVPHIGWNSLVVSEKGSWDIGILRSLAPGDAVYFVHSYMAEPEDETMRIADCIYGGNRISAVIGFGNIFGCQFHPEKSGELGLRIVDAFLNY